MPSIINTNIASLNTQRNLNSSQSALNTSLQRLSSGLRVNSAKDDAAGLAIGERMNAQIRGMNVAMRNSNDAISLSQTAEGGLGKIGDALQRMRELAVQSANATNTADDRNALQSEFTQLQSEITRVTQGTEFNGVKVLANASTTGLTFQVGANNVASTDQITMTAVDLSGTASATAIAATAGTTGTSISGTDGTSAQAAIEKVDAALKEVNAKRADFGAYQNRFESVVSNLQVSAENLSASRSRIMDADFAAETASLTRGQILQQAGTAMLAQANSLPNNVLSLLRG